MNLTTKGRMNLTAKGRMNLTTKGCMNLTTKGTYQNKVSRTAPAPASMTRLSGLTSTPCRFNFALATFYWGYSEGMSDIRAEDVATTQRK
jgi:hypothetical protein